MTSPERIQRLVRARINYERARAFGAPVMRSSHPDAILIGYSVAAIDGVDVMIESNHIMENSLSDRTPTSFTIRSWKSWDDPDDEWRFHSMDHVMNTHPGWQGAGESATDRGRLANLLDQAERAALTVRIDDALMPASTYRFEQGLFARLFLGTARAMVTVAAPREVIEAGFSTTIDDSEQ